MATKTTLDHGDRVRLRQNPSPRATATVVTTHTDKAANVSIQPDDRPRSRGCIVVAIADVERVSGPPNKCPLCASRHSVFACPKGA